MIALMILGGILLLLGLLLCTPVAVELFAGPSGERVRLHVLFLRFSLYPQKAESEKKKPKKKKKQLRKEKKKRKKKPEEDKSLSGSDIWALVKSSRGALRLLRRHTVFSHMHIYLGVGGEDAHQAALAAGRMSLAVACALDILGTLFVLRRPEVVILPNFVEAGLKYEVAARISIRPVFVLVAGIRLLVAFLRVRPAPKKKQPASEPVKSV